LLHSLSILVAERSARPFILDFAEKNRRRRGQVSAGPNSVAVKRKGEMHDWRPKMWQAVQHFAEQLRGIRTGTISVGLVQSIRVDCQGALVPINRLGAIKSQGDRILIIPFDRATVPRIVKALSDSRLGAYALDPTTVCVSIPPLSVQQRQETVRHVKKLGEEAKIGIRSIRQQARKQIEASGRGSQRAVQEATDAAIGEIEELVNAKMTELA
jgi:ribosome recycling factor